MAVVGRQSDVKPSHSIYGRPAMIRTLLYNPFEILFFLLPPVFVLLRYFKRTRISMWTGLLGFLVVGHVLLNLAVHCHYAILGWMVRTHPNPPQEWVEALTYGDGPKMIVAFLFGWLYAAVYFLVWLWLVSAIWLPIRFLGGKRAAQLD